MMASGTWTREKAKRQEIADRFGIALETLKGYSAEASRMLTIDKDDLAALRAENVAVLLRIAADAEARQNMTTGLPDYRSAIEARKVASEYAGLKLDEPVPGANGPERPQQIRIVLATQPEPVTVTKPEPEK